MDLDLREEEGSALNITPLIDIVFQLILFLLVASSLSDEVSRERSAAEEQKIDLDLPESDAGAPSPERPEVLVVNLDERGACIVRGRSLARRELRALLVQTAEKNPRTPISIRGHRAVVLQRVVDVMSDCHRAGLRNLDIRVLAGATPERSRGEDPLELPGSRDSGGR